MKNILGIVSSLVLAFCVEAVNIDGYNYYAECFSRETDPIRGFVLNNSGILEKLRFYGDIKYNNENQELRNAGNCYSFKDTSYNNNPMTDLVIQLFPSAGAQCLNANGTGSLRNADIDIVKAIVGMFVIAKDVRERGKESEISKFLNLDNSEKAQGQTSREGGENEPRKAKMSRRDFTDKYFGTRTNNISRLITLSKNIAAAVLLEKGAKDGAKDPSLLYPSYFVNDLICAYVWHALSNEELGNLENALKNNEVLKDSDESAQSSASKWSLWKDIIVYYKGGGNLVPFRSGDVVLTNGKASYNNQNFADCVETTFRQFFAVLFCSCDTLGNLCLDETRIPEGSNLREFFTSRGKDIWAMVADGTKEVRDEWAKVVSGLKIDKNTYCKKDCELDTGWGNFIKVFCFLMDGYSAGEAPNELEPEYSAKFNVWERKKRAQERIKSINEARSNGTLNISAAEVLESINDLLGIRTDVKLVAECRETDLKKNRDIEGKIYIYPEGYKKENLLCFSNNSSHACLRDIASVRCTISANKEMPWIEQLYYDRAYAIRGEQYVDDEGYQDGRNVYPILSNSSYPVLEYYLRLSSGIRNEFLIQTIAEKLNDGEKYIESIARLFYSDDILDLLALINAAQKAKVPKENIVTLCDLIANRAISLWHTSVAVSFLQENDPSKIVDFKNKTISKDSSIVDFMVQICNLGNYGKIKSALIEKLENCDDKTLGEVGDLFVGIGKFFERYPQKIFLFEVDILNSLLPHIEAVAEKLEAFEEPQPSYKPASDIVSILDLVDFNNTSDDVLSRFVTSVRNKLSSPVFDLTLSFHRSDEKLEFLLPMCRTSDRLANQILETYTGKFNLVELIKKLFWWRRYHINRSFVKSITEKYGKFTSAEAKELVIFLKKPTVVIPFIKSGEVLPHEAVEFLDISRDGWELCEMINYIYENNILMFPLDNEDLLKKMLLTPREERFPFDLFQNLLYKKQLSMDLMLLYLTSFIFSLEVSPEVLNQISCDGVIPTDAIKTTVKYHIRVNSLLGALSRGMYKIHKDAAIELICGIEWDCHMANFFDDNVSECYAVCTSKALSLLLDEDKMFSREDIDKLCFLLKEKQNQLENIELEHDLIDRPQCIDFKECINLIKEHCNQNDISYLEEKFNTFVVKE